MKSCLCVPGGRVLACPSYVRLKRGSDPPKVINCTWELNNLEHPFLYVYLSACICVCSCSFSCVMCRGPWRPEMDAAYLLSLSPPWVSYFQMVGWILRLSTVARLYDWWARDTHVSGFLNMGPGDQVKFPHAYMVGICQERYPQLIVLYSIIQFNGMGLSVIFL